MENMATPAFNLEIIELETVSSTNWYAAEFARAGSVTEGTVIRAKFQTDGKGQGDNKWESESGMNLTFSLILKPLFLHPENQFHLNKSIALGVLDFVRNLNIPGEFKLKWPNDIYAGNRKLGGILINNTITGSEYSMAIAGIGLNINQVTFDPLLPAPVSLKNLSGESYSLNTCFMDLLHCLSYRYTRLQTGYEQEIGNDYQQSLLGIDEERSFVVSGTTVRGTIRGVDPFGRLIVEGPDKMLQLFIHREIEFIL